MLHYAILCYIMLYHVISCYITSYYVESCHIKININIYVILFYIMLYYVISLYYIISFISYYYTRCPKKNDTQNFVFFLLNLTVTELYQTILVRGGIKIENRENLGQCPNRGGGVKKTRNVPISIWEFFKNVPISVI